jgi:hypothetical protein
MQGLKGAIIVAMIVTTGIVLAGCVGHHEKAVVAEPLKVG